MKLIFATHNEHKAQEVGSILGIDNLEVATLSQVGYHEEIVEDGLTLEENASIKSRTIYDKFGGNVFSEDTGLEVMALNMEPGVHTARYAGEQKSAADNMNKLLFALEGTHDRTARFRTVVSLIWEGEEYLFEGIVNGRIAGSKSGTDGFGYDPIFIPFGYDKTFAELPASVKNSISHRFRAMCQMQSFFKTLVTF